MEKIGPMRFIYAFMDVVENHGIFDEYDADEDCMVTSEPIQDLIDMANEMLPDRVSNEEAASMMRELTTEEREHLINQDKECVVVDLRDHFAQKMAEHGSARGLLIELAEAQRAGDHERVDNLLDVAEEFRKREKNVP